MAGILTYMNNYTPIEPNDIFVLPTPEYQEAVASQKFDPIQVEKILYYPDGEPGFYFVRLAYASNVEEIFEAERLARLVPVVDTLQIGDQEVTVSHSRLDAGSLADAFDDDLGTLMRGQEANPFMLDFSFPEPRTLQGFQGDFSAFDYKITIELYAPGSDTPVTYVAEEQNVNIDFHVDIAFDKGPEKVARVKILVHNLLLPLDSANIHIRGLKFLP